MGKQSDKIAEAIDTLKQAGFAVFEPGFVPHVLISVNGGDIQLITNSPVSALIIDSDTMGMDDDQIIAGIFDEDGYYENGGYDIRTPRVQTYAGPISEFFKPSDTIGGLEPDRPALYKYFKSINF